MASLLLSCEAAAKRESLHVSAQWINIAEKEQNIHSKKAGQGRGRRLQICLDYTYSDWLFDSLESTLLEFL